jgi:hypothetical protein
MMGAVAAPRKASTGRALVTADWYEVRRAVNAKPTTYRCPFCGKQLASMSEHVLIRPLGQGTDRRHAHTQCTLRERAAGRLPSRDEWRKAQPKRPGWLARLFGRRG